MSTVVSHNFIFRTCCIDNAYLNILVLWTSGPNVCDYYYLENSPFPHIFMFTIEATEDPGTFQLLSLMYIDV